MSNDIKEKLKQLSNPFSTGGGGGEFEHCVQAVFLLALLVEGFCPVLDIPIDELLFQGKHEGYHTDDLIAFAAEHGRTGKILCQIKNDIAVTSSSKVFQDVITAAWNDFKNERFNKESDRIVLITNVVAKTSMDALRKIYEQANASNGAEDFLRRLQLSNFVNSKTREKFNIMKLCLKNAEGRELQSTELYNFCKAFLPIVFDGNYQGSIQEALCKSLIRCKSDQDPKQVWSMLKDYAGQCNPSAAHITKERVDWHIKELFGFTPKDGELDTFIPYEQWAQLILIGAWDENKEADRLAIEEITGTSYGVFQRFARETLQSGSPFLSLTNGIWHVSPRKELFPRVSSFYYDDIVTKAFRVASNCVRELSAQFEREDAYALLQPEGGWYSNSDSFRKDLCEGLCILANGSKSTPTSTGLIEHQAFLLIHHLFEDCSWKTLAGLGALTSTLAELSPTAFLAELESFSVQRKQELKQLFPKKDQRAIWDTNYTTHLLWALESLAWVPQYFSASVRCLWMMELSGYEKTNYANTPLNSIISILNAFQPQTFASIEQKKLAILALQKDSPELCWTVIKTLLPDSSFILADTPKPRFISLSPFERDVPQSETDEMLQYYTDTALQLSSGSPKRLAELTSHTAYMSSSTISDYLNQIITAAQNWNDEMKYPVWDSLCALRVKAILDNEHTKPDSKLFSILEQAISAVIPEGKWYQYLHLYTRKLDEYYLDDSSHSWENREKDRTEAVFDLYVSYGLDSVLSFGTRVNDLHSVGWKLGTTLKLEQIIDVLDEYSKNMDSLFYSTVLSGFIEANGIDILNAIKLEKYEPSFRAKVLFAAPFAPETFILIEKFLPDKTLYWKDVPATWFSPDWSQQTLEYVIQELKESKRFSVIIYSLGHLVKKYDLVDELLESILLGAASEQSLNQINAHAACSIIKKLQESGSPHINTLAEIEYAYLPFLTESSITHPKALYYKLSNDDVFFCWLMELMYKPRHKNHKSKNLSDGVRQRLFLLMYNYCVVPGVDWKGVFNADKFHEWIDRVLLWAEKTDRIEVTQQTIGNGMSYAKTEDGLPNDTILAELNKPQNKEMRLGYQIGIQNQRGAHWVDPEGKPELALAKKFNSYANTVKERGYTRFSETLESIAKSYMLEAEEIKMHESSIYYNA